MSAHARRRGGGDALGRCNFCGLPAARTCTACGMAICEVHASTDRPMFCFQCARGHGHTVASPMPDSELEKQFSHDLERVKE